jgi:hypothetical protein
LRAIDDDILSQGGDREPNPRWRRLVLITALVLAVAGGGAYLAVTRQPTHPAAARPAPTASPARPQLGANLPAEPDGIAGQTLSWSDDLRLPAAGTRPSWFSPASGQAEPISGLPANASGYQFTRVGGGWAVQANPAAAAACGGCAAPPAPVWFLADGAHAVTVIGTADLVAPAAADGAVWLTSYPRGASLLTAAGTAREVRPGAAPVGPVTVPAGYAIAAGTTKGLLLRPVSQQAAQVGMLWDPAGGRAGQSFTGLLAAAPGAIAWSSPCARQCTVQTLDLATGHQATLKLPAGSSAVSADFSPDGRYLAVQDSFGNTGDGGDLAMQLEVAPLATGQLSAVPGTWVSSDALVGYGWPGGSDSLVAEFSFTTKMQLASWHPGATRPAVALLRSGPDQGSLILG